MPSRFREYDLAPWYSSEDAKRKLGTLCRAINVQGESVDLLGDEDTPLLVLVDAEDVRASAEDIAMTIDEARANWSAMTMAALLYGTQFRISSSTRERAVLRRHPRNRHPACRYRRSTDRNLRDVVRKLEEALNDIRNLRSTVADTNELLARRFRELWRASQDMPASFAH